MGNRAVVRGAIITPPAALSGEIFKDDVNAFSTSVIFFTLLTLTHPEVSRQDISSLSQQELASARRLTILMKNKKSAGSYIFVF
jgi:hypothetical protein